MALPEFYTLAPRIVMHDPLAELLGASDDGLIEYEYADAVRLAGHSCPTVAGAWLMARAALRNLYPDAVAERGGVSVTMSAAENEGTTGVVAQIFTLVTGAAAANGFHGIGGLHARQGLLAYAGGDAGVVARFQRHDNGAAVGVALDASQVSPAPEMRMLLGRALVADATHAERKAFANAWQDRVRRLLLDHAEDAQVIRVVRYT